MKSLLSVVVVMAVVLSVVAGCSRGDSDRESPDVDPQVLKDVVAATFRVPGSEVLRAMRVDRFARELGIEECGGQMGPLDDTTGRVDQSKFPDLELIRQKGFSETEATQEEDTRLDALGSDCKELAPDLDAYDDWNKLQGPWQDVALTAEQDPRLDPTKQPMATCLTKATGLAVDPSDPVISYMRAVNLSASDDATAQQNADRAVAYADCAGPYFDELRKILLAKRPAMVERHREVITQYAAELTEAGYVP